MGKALALRTEYRLQQWAKIADECSKSGMTNKDFCVSRGIPEKSYYYWLRRVREAAADAIGPQLVEITFNDDKEKSGILNMRYREADLKISSNTPADVLLTTLQVLKKL